MPRATFHIKQYKQAKLAAILSFAAILLLSIVFLQPFNSESSYAAEHSDNTSGSYNGTTYSLTTTVSDLNLELKNVTPAGKAVYGKQTVNVTTAAPGGYQLYMQTSGNLSGTKDGSATSDSIAALSTNNSALDTNSWGYVTAAALSSASTALDEDMNKAATQEVWNTPPSTLTQIDATSSAAASGRDTDIYYGIKADNTLTGDNYSGTITYTTIANDAASDTLLSVSPTSGTAGTATQLTIITSLMTTTDGLSASDISVTVGGYTCSPVSITSRAPLTFTCSVTASAAGTYAVTATISKYGKTYTKSSAYTVTTPTMDTVTYMQDVTQDMCKNATTYTTSNKKTYTLKDSRNSQSYQIRKLADERCWMVQNLYLTGGTQIASSNSDITAASYTLPASTSGGSTFSTSSSSDMNNGNTTKGSYYSWPVATAGTGSAYGSSTNNNPTSSICPKGWKLPTGGSSGEFQTLYNKYGSYSSFTGPWNFTAVGRYIKGSLGSTTYNFYWSRTGYDDSLAYGLDVYSSSSSVNATSVDYKYYGYSVRCVLSTS